MCLAVPAQIKEIHGTTATLDMAGNTLVADITITPDAHVGDWGIVHAGVVIEILDENEAQETLQLLRDVISSQTADT